MGLEHQNILPGPVAQKNAGELQCFLSIGPAIDCAAIAIRRHILLNLNS